MYDLKDREIEQAIEDNAAYKLFCGYGIVERWHAPDHTKIESFRSRLSPATQKELANLICKNAVDIGLAQASNIDIDSTVQESNTTYLTDAKMLRKLGAVAAQVSGALKKLLPQKWQCEVDLKSIASRARACFFISKNATKAEKATSLRAKSHGI